MADLDADRQFKNLLDIGEVFFEELRKGNHKDLY